MTDLGQYAIAKALRVDPPRAEPKIKLRVSSRSEGHVVAGVRLTAGDQTVEVYESDEALFRAEVETEDLSLSKARLAAYTDAVARKAKGEPIPDVALPRFRPSLEMAFREIHMRDMRPLTRVERLDERAPQKGR